MEANKPKYKLIDYLSNQLNEAEKKAVEEWINASQENAAFFEQVKGLWEGQSTTVNASVWNTEQGLQEVYQKINRNAHRQKIRTIRRVGKIAAVFVVIFGVTWYFFRQQTDVNHIALKSNGQIITDTLWEETMVTLNKHTTIHYKKPVHAGGSRTVNLKGEAFFEVSGMADHPFIVKTKNVNVVVSGTAFNVRAYPGHHTTVMVTSGSLNLTSNTKQADTAKDTISLKAGEKATYDTCTNKIRKSKTFDENSLSWKTNRLVFKDTPLIKTINILEKYYNTTIVIKDEGIRKLKITADFNEMKLESVLEIIAQTVGIRYKVEEEKIILYR